MDSVTEEEEVASVTEEEEVASVTEEEEVVAVDSVTEGVVVGEGVASEVEVSSQRVSGFAFSVNTCPRMYLEGGGGRGGRKLILTSHRNLGLTLKS